MTLTLQNCQSTYHELRRILMYNRKDYYAEEMGLTPLSKEGGYFKETFRSPQTISIPDREGGERNLFTTIYYMISPELGGKNYLHSNKSDNVHYFHDGWPAKYILVSPKGHVEEYVLGRNTSKGHVPRAASGPRWFSKGW